MVEKPGISAPPAAHATSAPTGSLVRSAYEQVKAAILACHLRPGTMVFAAELAERLEMSRTPVHEALKTLCQEGLLTVKPRRGYVVTEVLERDIRENFELRLSLEVLGAGLAAERASPQGIAALRDQCARAQENLSRAAWQDPAFLQSLIAGNTEFHVLVAALADNQRLERMVAGLLEENQRTYFLYYRSSGAPATEDHHGQILRAIVARDPNAAREAMGVHLSEAQERITFAATLPLGSDRPNPHR